MFCQLQKNTFVSSHSRVITAGAVHHVPEEQTIEADVVEVVGVVPIMRPHWTAFVGMERSDLHTANLEDDVKAVKALYLKYKDDENVDMPEEAGGIRRLLMFEAVQAGAVCVVAWLVSSCGDESYHRVRVHGTPISELTTAKLVHCAALGTEVSITTDDVKYESWLHVATGSGQVRMARLLLDLDADIEQKNYKGETALTSLLRQSNLAYFSSMVEPVGPRRHVRDFEDYRLACVCLLLHRGAAVSANVLAGTLPPVKFLGSVPKDKAITIPLPLRRYMADPPRDYPGISLCSSLPAFISRHALLLAWHSAQRQPEASKGLRELPHELMKRIVKAVGPFLDEVKPKTIQREVNGLLWGRGGTESLANPASFEAPDPTRLLGKTVLLRHLTHSLTHGRYNGFTGQVLSWEPATWRSAWLATGRFGVKLSHQQSLLAIKPANLYVKDHLGGLTSAVHFVGV